MRFPKTLLTELESEFYPPGFLLETVNTLRLLFPPESLKASYRIAKLNQREDVDLEVQIGKHISLDIESYPFWGGRLAAIQRRYDASKPKHIAQWYYDRRNPETWAMLWVAIIVFMFTLIFGIISSVTGILQVYAAWKFR